MKFLLPLTVIALLSFSGLAQATPNQLEINLQQAVDQNCDGISEQQTQAAPSECIIYSIEAINLGETSISKVQLTAKIPQYTKLYSAMKLKNSLLKNPTATYQQFTNKEGFITVSLGTLKAGEKHSQLLSYVVQVL